MSTHAYTPGIHPADERLIVIPPDLEFSFEHELMVARDLVLPIRDPNHLRSHFLGRASLENPLHPNSSNKVAYGVATPQHLRSVIYTDFVGVREQDNGAIRFRDLPGSVPSIIAQAPESIAHSGNVNTAVFYGITNISNKQEDPGSKGAGARLIENVYGLLKPHPLVRTTDSPTPDSPKWINERAGSSATSQDMIDLILSRSAQNLDPVGHFHLSNGAFIAFCQVAEATEGERHVYEGKRVMINYIYPGDTVRLALQQAYREQQLIAMAEPMTRRLNGNDRLRTLSVMASEVFPHEADYGLEFDRGVVTQRAGTRTSRQDDSSQDMLEVPSPAQWA